MFENEWSIKGERGKSIRKNSWRADRAIVRRNEKEGIIKYRIVYSKCHSRSERSSAKPTVETLINSESKKGKNYWKHPYNISFKLTGLIQ